MERQRVHKRGQSEWGDKLLAPLELEHTARWVGVLRNNVACVVTWRDS